MTPQRRFHSFNDHLRARFAERLHRVTLTGGLVCTHPKGKDDCPWCTEAARVDPGFGKGYPAHEQIRRGSNFTRRNGEKEQRLIVAIPSTPLPPPLDHLKATLETAAIDAVALVIMSARSEDATPEVAQLLAELITPEREVWLDLETAPTHRPDGLDEKLKVSLLISLEQGTGAGGAGSGSSGHRFRSIEEAAERVRALKLDGVGFAAPVIITGTPEADRLEKGEIEEENLETFADRAARFLELIPAEVVVQAIVVAQKADSVLAPAWVLNRQKVQEAIGNALKARDTTQSAGYSAETADGQ